MSNSWYAEGVSVLFLPRHMLFVIPLKFSLGFPLVVFSRITLLINSFWHFVHNPVFYFLFIYVCLFVSESLWAQTMHWSPSRLGLCLQLQLFLRRQMWCVAYFDNSLLCFCLSQGFSKFFNAIHRPSVMIITLWGNFILIKI